jgi:hypothetical protein
VVLQNPTGNAEGFADHSLIKRECVVRLLLGIALALLIGSASDSPASPLIAVLDEEGFPTTKASTIAPSDVIEDLNAAGLQTRGVTIAEAAQLLGDTDNAPAILISVHGNAFPDELGALLPAYLQSGHAVLSNGIPMVHRVERTASGWENRGHDESLARSLGIGEFGGSRNRMLQVDPLGEKLGLGGIPWEILGLREDLQGLLPGTVGEGWTAEPVLSDQSGLAFSALLSHESGGHFAWTGTTDFGVSIAASRNLHRELVRRLVVEILARNNSITQESVQALLAPVDSSVVTGSVGYAYEPLFIEKRAESLYPSAHKAPRILHVLDVGVPELPPGEQVPEHAMSPEDDLLLSSVQGLTNSRTDSDSMLYIVRRESDRMWLRWLLEQGYVEGSETVDSLADAIESLGVREAILVPTEPPQAINAAMLLAARDNRLLVYSQASADRFGLEIVDDLTGRWSNNIEVLQSILADHGDEISREVVAVYSPSRLHHLRDYLIANRVFTFWISGPAESSISGVDPVAEGEFVHDALASQFPVNIPVLGYPWAGDGVGIGEGGGVSLLSSAGKFLVPSDWMPNLTVFTAFEAQHDGPLAPAPPAPTGDPTGVYASLVMSDGDNLCTWVDFFPSYWEKLPPGHAPVAWTIGPSIRDLLPPIHDALAQWHPKGHTLGAAVSGIGYVYIEAYGIAFGDRRDEVVREFMHLTNEACRRQGLEWIWIMGYGGPGNPLLGYYAGGLPDVPTVLGGYGREATTPAEAIEQRGDMLIFHSVNGAHEVEGILRDVDQILRTGERPLFLHVFLLNWSVDADDLGLLVEELGKRGVTIVPPEHLSTLAREASPD